MGERGGCRNEQVGERGGAEMSRWEREGECRNEQVGKRGGGVQK